MKSKKIIGLFGIFIVMLCCSPLTVFARRGGISRDDVGDWINYYGYERDGSDYTDIKNVVFWVSRGYMTVVFTLADNVPLIPETDRLFYVILIDADQNPNTGRPVGWGDTGESAIYDGVDYEISLFYDNPNPFYTSWNYWVNYYSPTGGTTVCDEDPVGSFSINRNRIKMTFSLDDIGISSNFDVVFATWEYNPASPQINAWDRTPNDVTIEVGI